MRRPGFYHNDDCELCSYENGRAHCNYVNSDYAPKSARGQKPLPVKESMHCFHAELKDAETHDIAKESKVEARARSIFKE